MSDDDPDDAPADDAADDEQGADAADDDQPEIEDDEMADFGAVADEIEEAAGADQEDDDGDDREDSDDEGEPSLSMDATADDRVTPGDIYCNALGMGAAVARASYGTADPDERSDLVDEYGDMARDLEIDTYVDQWLEEHGGIDELGPGQAIMLSTVMFGGMVAMDDPEMVENVAQRGGEA